MVSGIFALSTDWINWVSSNVECHTRFLFWKDFQIRFLRKILYHCLVAVLADLHGTIKSTSLQMRTKWNGRWNNLIICTSFNMNQIPHKVYFVLEILFHAYCYFNVHIIAKFFKLPRRQNVHVISFNCVLLWDQIWNAMFFFYCGLIIWIVIYCVHFTS